MLHTIVFDMDGVVYRGATGIPGVSAAIARLQRKLQVLFLTNNSTRSREAYVRRLATMGIRAQTTDLMTSAFGCACYVRDRYGSGRRVFVIGEQGLRHELKWEAAARLVRCRAEVVAVGLDRKLTYRKLDLGLSNLLSGARLVVTNSDPTFPTERGLSPGGGAIAAALSCASGREADAIIGKPSTWLIEKLLREHGAKPRDSVFVGDRLDTDIRMANQAGMKSVLVLTGVSGAADVRSAAPSDKPDAVIPSAADIEALL